ncbi:MAG: HNH endonuclease signature motif containing protein [Pseudomonadota bacterium]
MAIRHETAKALAEIRGCLTYDAATGELRWRRAAGNRAAGARAGSANSGGYVLVRVNGREYCAHRVAWAMAHGEWPAADRVIDHANNNPGDNRLSNLRLATQSENCANRSYRRRPWHGTHLHRSSGKYAAQIKVNGLMRHLGLFESRTEAKAAYDAAAKRAFGDFS